MEITEKDKAGHRTMTYFDSCCLSHNFGWKIKSYSVKTIREALDQKLYLFFTFLELINKVFLHHCPQDFGKLLKFLEPVISITERKDAVSHEMKDGYDWDVHTLVP